MWFSEDAWSPIIACVASGVVFFIAYTVTQRVRLLYPIPILLLAAITIFFLERAIVTDRERVEQTLFDLIETFREDSQRPTKDRPPLCLQYFGARNDRDKARVIGALLIVRVDHVRVTDVQVRLTNENTRAITHFRANADVAVAGSATHYPSRWELTWQKEAGEWKVTMTRMLNAMTGEEQVIPRVDR